MAETITLTSLEDGFEFSAWHTTPTDARRGGLVICHAIWGVTPHLRDLAAQWADDGYEVIVPSLFDRFSPGFADQDTDPAKFAIQSDYAERTQWGATTLGDVQTAINALQGPVFLLGFCFGGTAAWLAACRCERLTAAACYYGGHIVDYADETPRCPTILHFGKTDALIPPADIDVIASAHPDLPIFQYDAGHAFVAPSGFHADAAKLSRLRTLQLFARQGGRGEA